MQRLCALNLAVVVVVFIGVCGGAAASCLAGGSICLYGPDTKVCAEWSRPQTPSPISNFRVYFVEPLKPSIEVISGDDWNFSAEDRYTGTLVEIGEVTINPNQPAENFTVSVTRGGGAGATNIDVIDLTAANWGGHSSVGDINISGDFTGRMCLTKSAGGQGGDLSGAFVIGGSLTGTIKVPVISGSLSVGQVLSGSICVTDEIKGGSVAVAGDVTESANITIEDMVTDNAEVCSLQFSTDGDTGDSKFSGDLMLATGLKLGHGLTIGGTLTSTASVDLNDEEVRGSLWLGAAEEGAVVMMGDVAQPATVQLTTSRADEQAVLFSGTAVFGDIDGVEVGLPCRSGNVDGRIIVDGDMAGQLKLGDGLASQSVGNLLPGGAIVIKGDLTGNLFVGGEMAGSITVTGDVSNDLWPNMASMEFLEGFGNTARIKVDGLLDGPITIADGTAKLSVMHLAGGLGADGSILVNTNRGM